MADPFPTPVLKAFESTASSQGRVEKLTTVEFSLLAQLLRYPEQIIQRESLKHISGVEDQLISDRKLDQWMRNLIRKTNALYPDFPVVRFAPPDGYVYTEVPPPKKKQRRED
jgi:DNA-binding response OmpR family regulator